MLLKENPASELAYLKDFHPFIFVISFLEETLQV